MADWIFGEESKEFSVCADWDDRWRTGGTLEEVLDEAHLTRDHIIRAITKFANTSSQRLEHLSFVLSPKLQEREGSFRSQVP